MLASVIGERDTAELLIEFGATIDARNKNGCTPLMLASSNGETDTATLLIKKGAKFGVKDSKGRDVLELAKERDEQEVAKLSKKHVTSCKKRKREVNQSVVLNKKMKKKHTKGKKKTEKCKALKISEVENHDEKQASEFFKSRFLDNGLGEAVRTPLKGIKKLPLVSLENAVRECCNLHTDLEYEDHLELNVECALDTADEIRREHKGEKLSRDKIGALNLYTQESIFYPKLNMSLRKADRKSALPFFKYLRLLTSALAKLPNVKRTVFRGMRVPTEPKLRKTVIKKYAEGSKVTEWGVTSATTTQRVISGFLSKKGLNMVFTLECHRLKSIKKYSAIQKEDEMLIGMATRFKVVSRWNLNGAEMVQMKELEKIPLWS